MTRDMPRPGYRGVLFERNSITKCWSQKHVDVPSNANSKSSFRPISTLYDWHLSAHVTTWAIKNFMRVSMITSGVLVRMGWSSIMRMRHNVIVVWIVIEDQGEM